MSHSHQASIASHHANDVGVLAPWRHEVDDRHSARRRLDRGLQDERVLTIRTADPGVGIRGFNQPASVVWCAEQSGETRTRVESRPAEPIDRATSRDECRRLAIPDDGVVLERRAHEGAPNSSTTLTSSRRRMKASRQSCRGTRRVIRRDSHERSACASTAAPAS